jgi:heptosyltransferase-2
MIGDVLTSGILFSILRELYPNAKLHYLINSHTYPVVKHHPDIDEFHFITPDIEKKNHLFFKFVKAIRKEKYDIVIDVYSKLSSNMITLFSGAQHRFSKYKWYSTFIYSKTFKEDFSNTKTGWAVENRLKLLAPLAKYDIKPVKPQIYLTATEINNAKNLLLENGVNLDTPIFMISILGSSIKKTYPPEYMAKLIDCIASKVNCCMLFNYMPNQLKDVKHIYNICNTSTQKKIRLDIFGKSLREFIAITSHCTALIGNEGGAINMAKAIKKPTFAIFSPWIIKEAWNMYDNGTTNDSIHLIDIKPELYNGKSPKLTKEDYATFYDKFLPELIIPKLKNYLDSIL